MASCSHIISLLVPLPPDNNIHFRVSTYVIASYIVSRLMGYLWDAIDLIRSQVSTEIPVGGIALISSN